VIGLANIITDLAAKYRLQESQVKDALDMVLSSNAFRRATNSVYGELTSEGVIVFAEDGVRHLGELKRPLSRLLSAELERILTDAATAVELDQWVRLRRQVIRARIERVAPDGTLDVVVERTGVFGETAAEVIGHCSPRNQSKRDRETLRPGEYRYFSVQRVEARRQGTAPATIAIELSRTTPQLPEYLIKRGLQGEKVPFRCLKRVVGKVSYIESEGFIPTHVIKEAGRELGERIKVDFTERDTARQREKSR